MSNCNYSSIHEVIEKLNKSKLSYIILRNYENLLSNEMYLSGHEDIDILCERSEDIVSLLGAKQSEFHRKGIIRDRTHYYIYVNNKKVDLDLRFYGDGYYCIEWERKMLEQRKMYNGFYVPDDINYFYSLLYHAILQKKVFTEDYRKRIYNMSKELSITLSGTSDDAFIKVLQTFMKQNGYKCTYTQDFYIPLQFQKIIRDLVQSDFKLQIRHRLYNFKIDFIQLLVKIKHLLIG